MKNPNLTPFYPAKVQWLAVAAVAMMAAAGQAKAQVVNFDFPGISGDGGVSNFFGQGALSDPGNSYWNGGTWSQPQNSSGGFTTANNLESDGVTSTAITLTGTGFGAQFNRGTQSQYVGTEPDGSDSPGALLAPFAYGHGSTSYTLTLNNVAAGSYNIFLYATNSDSANLDATVFTIGGQSLTADNNNAPTAVNSFVEGANYVEFTGIAPVSGVISIVASVGPDGANNEADFNGLQLQAASVPEPSTYALLLAGVGSMVVLMRNKKIRNW